MPVIGEVYSTCFCILVFCLNLAKLAKFQLVAFEPLTPFLSFARLALLVRSLRTDHTSIANQLQPITLVHTTSPVTHHTFRSQLATDILHCLDADDASNQVTKQGTLGLSKPGVQLSSQKANALKNRPDLHPLCKLEVVEAAAKEKKRKVSVLRAAFFGVGQILTPLSVLLRTTSVPARRSTRCKNRKTPPTWSGSKHTAAPLLLLFVGMYSYSNACVDCHVRLCKGEPNVSARSELVTWKRRKQRTSHARVLPKLSEASIPLRAHHCWRRSIRRSLTPV
jgi:hypothetical protein